MYKIFLPIILAIFVTGCGSNLPKCDDKNITNSVSKTVHDGVIKMLDAKDANVNFESISTEDVNDGVQHCSADILIKIKGAKYKTQSVSTVGNIAE